jgi:DNA-binding response OmpR family regulator/DNA-binding IscR family transcriptional regulator
MNRKAVGILIVDDDKGVRETLSAILRSRGYQITSVTTASEALEKARVRFFDILLLDINLPDMEGTQLLSHFQKMAPETLKIIITGYPSVRNAADALNIGADSYLTKPLDPDHLLRTIEDKLQEREEKERITGKKLTEWVKLRVQKTQSSQFEEFLERNAAALVSFALNKTQAKIYIGLNALGVASASEIASLSKIRREEVYRAMPELQKRGLITSKFGAPRRYAAVRPKTALKILTKTRIKAMKEEASNLRQKKDELMCQLKKTSYGIEEENSIEAFSQQDNVLMRLVQTTRKARQQIMLASSFEQLETMFLKAIRRVAGTNPGQVSVRIIIGGSELEERDRELDDVHMLKALQVAQEGGNKIELRRVQMLPFNLLIVDWKEAIWGEFQPEDTNRKILWTNDSTQIGILQMAFEKLWQEAQMTYSNLGRSAEEHSAEVL